MSARITIDRILRDDNDASGQSIRSWTLQCEPGYVMIRPQHEGNSLLLRVSDVEVFAENLKRAQEAAKLLSAEHS
jgi:hypothetical protein